MIRRFATALVLTAFASIAAAQIPGHVQEVCSEMQDGAGNLLASGTLTFYPVLTAGSTVAAAPMAGGGGRAIALPVVYNITNGVCSPAFGNAQLLDVSQSSPANFCYKSVVHDNNSGLSWQLDSCYQPAYNIASCSLTGGVTTCDYDNYVPPGTPGELLLTFNGGTISQNLYGPSATFTGTLTAGSMSFGGGTLTGPLTGTSANFSAGVAAASTTSGNVNGVFSVDPVHYTSICAAYTACLNSSVPACKIDANGSGTVGTTTATAGISGGAVTSYALTYSGYYYTTAPTVTVVGGGGSGATVTATLTGSQVSTLTITNGGTGYTSAPTLLFSPPPAVNTFCGAMDFSAVKPIDTDFGSYTYYLPGQVTLGNSSHLKGAGYNKTKLVSTDAVNESMFIIPQANSKPATGVLISDMEIMPSTLITGTDTQVGIDIECGSFTNMGLWYSTLARLWVGDSANTFPGGGLKFDCDLTTSAIQWDVLDQVYSFRPAGSTNPALYICGKAFGNNKIENSEFDASTWSDPTTGTENIYVGICPGGSGGAPYSTTISDVTSQGGTLAWMVNGANNDVWEHIHGEGTVGITNFMASGAGAPDIMTIDGVKLSNIGTGGGSCTASQSAYTVTIASCSSGSSVGSTTTATLSGSGWSTETLSACSPTGVYPQSCTGSVGPQSVSSSPITVATNNYVFNFSTINSSSTVKIKGVSCGYSVASMPNWWIQAPTSQHLQVIKADETNTCIGPTSGVTNYLSGNTTTLTTYNMQNVHVNDTSTVNTITSQLSPNLPLCFTAQTNPLAFSNSGNICLNGASSLTIPVQNTACFRYTDYSGCWALQSSTANGSVTSVALQSASPNLFSGTAGAAVTSSGTLDPDAQLKTQAANTIVAGPASGSAAQPTARALVNADFPNTLAPTFSGQNLTSLPTQFANGVPPWLQYLGTGADGALGYSSGSTAVNGIKYATTFNVASGATVTVTGSGLTVHATGACTINGTISANGVQGSPSFAINYGGGPGGGGGGGTAAGTVGSAQNVSPAGTTANITLGTVGAAGGASGGAGGSATTSGSATRLFQASGGGIDAQYAGGSNGGAGGSTGGAGGKGGLPVTLICGSITGTGTIDTSGGYGTPSAANSSGSGGGGGAGPITLSSQAPETYSIVTMNAPGSGAGGGTTTSVVPEAIGYGGVGVTTEPVVGLAVSGGALSGTCTVLVAGASSATGSNAPVGWNYAVVGGGGTLGTGSVSFTWSSGSVASCSITSGSSSGYTAATYSPSGTGGNGGASVVNEYSGW